MKFNKKLSLLVFLLTFGICYASMTANQTDQLSTVLPGNQLPFRIVIEEENFQLPVGIHSGVVGVYKGQWVFIAGRINGLHGFSLDPFPPDLQNTRIYVVDSNTGITSSRSLYDPSSGLTQQQIDFLSVTSPQGYQVDATLYMTGGYGIDNGTRTYSTKPVLTAFNLPGIIQWVTQPGDKSNSVTKNIQQVYNPIFQIAGGKMLKLGDRMMLVFGQNFTGVYTPNSNGNYSNQVRQFRLKQMNGNLAVDVLNSNPSYPDPNYRRRDLNVVPAILNKNGRAQYGLIAYAGVFTLTSGVWTVPVIIDENGVPSMANPNLPTTFKQAMNQYVCAATSIYSKKFGNMYNIFFGGLTYGFFSGGTFETDSEIPFTNQVTTVQMDRNGNFTQYIMANEYPVIISTDVNPGNPLLFGAGAYFIIDKVLEYPNHIISLDNIRKPTVIGHIVGGIQSTVPNTSSQIDSSASPHIFKVTLVPS